MNTFVSRLLRLSPVGLLFMIGCTQPHPASTYPEPFYGELLLGDSLITAEPQQKTEREYRELATVVKKTFTVPPDRATDDTPAEIIMAMPAHAGVDENEEYLFLMDGDSLVINKYALSTGALLKVIDEPGKRQKKKTGPGKLAVTPNNELWLKGVENREVLRLDFEGNVLGNVKGPISGYVTQVNDHKVVHNTALNEDELFHVYSLEGVKEHSFGIMSSTAYKEGSIGHGIGFVGEVVGNGSNSFLFAGLFGGGLLRFEENGELSYFRESMDHNPFPGTILYAKTVAGNSETVDMAGVRTQQIPINVWNGVYYQNVSLIKEKRMIVDAYAYDTGEYLYSLPVKSNECGYVFITDDHIYANCAQGFVQLERPASVNDRLVSENLRD
ncbi:MAG: hypothetical protein AB8G77_02445 [Rhodothermales bacterium]